MPNWQRWLLAAMLTFSGAAPASAQPPAPLPSVHISLPASQENWRAPLTDAAAHAAAIASDWLGPHPSGAITITAAPPFWQGTGAMIAERQVATDVIRSWWPSGAGDQHARAIVDGFASYLQGQALERAFDRRYLRRAYRAESARMFGGHVIWSFPTLRLSREAAIDDRYAAMFATLERLIGEPALQGAMFVAARVPAERLTGTTLINTISAAAGQDLAWWFTLAADPAMDIDYAVTALDSTAGPCASPSVDTTVTVARLGTASISAPSARHGSFDSGDALALRVAFDDGQHASVRWDGGDDARTFRFHGPAKAIAAHLDADRVILLDANLLNNAITRPAATNVPVRKWVARWIAWMQNAVLTYGFFA